MDLDLDASAGSRAKFALVIAEGGHLTAFVDPGFPAAWRGAPYFETFKRWSLEGVMGIAPATPLASIA